jgi:Sulfotransferase family
MITSLKVSRTDRTEIVPRQTAIESGRIEANEFNKRGLFIGGAAKSGTTLLMSLLDNHPQLVVLPEESHYLEKRRDFLNLHSYHAKLANLLTNLKPLASAACYDISPECGIDARDYAQFDYDQFVSLAANWINQPWMNDSLLLSETIRAYGTVAGVDWHNCVRWVEKTPGTESYGDALDELFPEAKLIQIVRDPRAVFASIKNRDVKEHGFYHHAHKLTRMWNRSAREISRLRSNPSRFLVIRYEDLVRNSGKILKAICRFGGFEFSEAMLEPTRAGSGWLGNSAFYRTFNGISAAPLDKWKDYLTPHEIWWIELHCRKGMESAGYMLRTDACFSLWHWLKRLPGESLKGYLRSRRDSLRQWLGLLKECREQR